MPDSFAQPASQLGQPSLGNLEVAAAPTLGQGVALGLDGLVPALSKMPYLQVAKVSQTFTTGVGAGVQFNVLEVVRGFRKSLLDTSTGIFSFPVQGIYAIVCWAQWNTGSGAGTRYIDFQINAGTSYVTRETVAGGDAWLTAVTLLNLGPGNTDLRVIGTQTSGGNLDLDFARLSICLLTTT